MPIPGVLKVEDTQILLTLLGRLTPPWEFARSASPEVILGVTTSGACITLLHCSFSTGRESFAGARSTTFRASLLLWGIHRNTASAASPAELWVHFSNLEAWLDQPSVLTDWGKSVNGELRRPIISYANHLVSADGLEVRASLKTVCRESARSLEVEDRAAVVFRALDHRSLMDYLSFVRVFRTFLVLATSSQVRVTEVIAIFEEPAQEQDSAVRRIPARAIGYDLSLEGGFSPIPSHRFLFTFSALGTSASNVVTRWFQLFSDLESVVSLYSFTAHRHDLIGEERFLNAVKACESFHRSILANSAVENSPRRKRHHRGEPLRLRLEEVWRFAGDDVTALLPIQGSDLVRKTVAGRNFLTHYSEDIKSAAPNLSELPTLARWWLIVLEACLLVHSGVGRSEVKTFFQRQAEFYRERFLEWRDIEYHPC